MLSEKEPDVTPLAAWVPTIVGFCEVDQHKPLSVIVEPPLLAMVPPQLALVAVIEPTTAVDTRGAVVPTITVTL
jgi:hypothetical protein